MNKLAKLLDLVESFYRQAMEAYSLSKTAAEPYSYVSPDDGEDDTDSPAPSSYEDLTQLAHTVTDPGLSSELLLISEMYKKALEIGTGWNTVYRGISTLLNMSLDDEEDPEQERVEDVLNDVVKDLRNRAGGPGGINKPDSPEVVAQLKRVKDDFNTQSLQEEMKLFDAPDEETAPEGTSVLDPFEGAGEGGKGRGFSFISKKPLKDWVESYVNERERYQDQIHQPAPKHVHNNLKELIETLQKLEAKTIAEMKVTNELAAAPDPAKEADRNKLRAEISGLKKERRRLKLNLRQFELSQNLTTIQHAVSKVKDPREKLLLEQEAKLRELQISRHVGKRKEINLRKVLIKSMSGGNMPGPDTLKKMLDKIEEAGRDPERKSPKEYSSIEGKALRERILSGSLIGLLDNFLERIRTYKASAKKDIVDSLIGSLLKAKEAELKPFKDAVDAARKLKDKPALDIAIKNLNNAMNKKEINDQAELHPTIVEIATRCNQFRDTAYVFKKLSTPGRTEEPDDKEKIQNAITTLEALIKEAYGKEYTNAMVDAALKVLKHMKPQDVPNE